MEKVFYKSAEKRDRTRFAVLVRSMTEVGRLAGDGMGHWLQGRFRPIFEFKTPRCRLFAFREGPDYYVVSGAEKSKPKKQKKDYARALELRNTLVEQFQRGDSDDKQRRK